MIAVVGAGIAGLLVASLLQRAGRRVEVFEAAPSSGGRVRTTISNDGFRFDEGFQVLFTAYPALRRNVPLATLQPCYFASGIDVALDGQVHSIGHPVYDPQHALKALGSGLVSPQDAIPLGMFLARSLGLGDARLRDTGRSTAEGLRDLTISDRLREQALAPLFAGITLDDTLSSDETFFRFVLRALAVGRTFLPAYGMSALSAQLELRLPREWIKLGAPIDEVVVDGDRVRGIRSDARMIDAEAVVVATDAPAAARLTGMAMPDGRRSCTTTYFTTSRPVSAGRRLMVNARGGLVNHVAPVSNVAPTYAPRGRHLTAAVALSSLPGSDDQVAAAMLTDMSEWLPDFHSRSAEPLHIVRVPFSQFAQPPGTYAKLPESTTSVAGLFLAGEYVHSSSIQGALRSAEWAATAVDRYLA